MKSPSQWHDGHDAGHDQMVADVANFVEQAASIPAAFKSIDPLRRDIQIEFPFTTKDGRILGFADICEIFTELASDGTKRDMRDEGKTARHYRAYEIKPVIHSVGQLIRQCKATHQMIANVLRSYNPDPHQTRGYSSTYEVIPVVPYNDPKVPLLEKMWRKPVWKWDQRMADQSLSSADNDEVFHHLRCFRKTD